VSEVNKKVKLMNIEAYLDILKLLLDKVPQGHWLIPVIALIISLKLLVPRIEVAFKFATSDKSTSIRRKINRTKE
jgi:hypothetical protein